MTIDRKRVIEYSQQFAFFVVASLVQPLFTCSSCITVEKYMLVAFLTLLMWVMLWMGNNMLTHYISTKISWIEFPIKRLVVGVVTTIGYTVLAIVGLLTFFERVFEFEFGESYQWTVYISVIITIIISLVMHSRAFLIAWKQAMIDSEKLKRENMSARYESLKNQVNPHFLFNSLNALTNLVYEDPDKAVKFIKQLSEVYRYVLESRDKEVVSLHEEVKFLESYFFLQRIRFGNKLKIDNQLSDQHTFIAPLALQMLIENAIKHNVVSEDDPLTIKLYMHDGYIVIENNLQPKKILETSNGVGLENISKRYQFLSDHEVKITKENNTFQVKLPVLSEVK
jgi:sensor histidine kinase YesM